MAKKTVIAFSAALLFMFLSIPINSVVAQIKQEVAVDIEEEPENRCRDFLHVIIPPRTYCTKDADGGCFNGMLGSCSQYVSKAVTEVRDRCLDCKEGANCGKCKPNAVRFKVLVPMGVQTCPGAPKKGKCSCDFKELPIKVSEETGIPRWTEVTITRAAGPDCEDEDVDVDLNPIPDLEDLGIDIEDLIEDL